MTVCMLSVIFVFWIVLLYDWIVLLYDWIVLLYDWIVVLYDWIVLLYDWRVLILYEYLRMVVGLETRIHSCIHCIKFNSMFDEGPLCFTLLSKHWQAKRCYYMHYNRNKMYNYFFSVKIELYSIRVAIKWFSLVKQLVITRPNIDWYLNDKSN